MKLHPSDLTRALELPLPGTAAHETMMPLGARRHRLSSISSVTRHGAVLITLVPTKQDTEVPLIQRSDDGGPHALQISLPGGAAEPEDHSSADTALREAQEEIGLEPQHVTVLGTLSDLYIDVSDFLITPVVAWYEGENPEDTFWPTLRRQPREVRRIVRGSLNMLQQTQAHRRVDARGIELTAPSFLAEDEIVWGATAMILGELLDLLRSTQSS
ncbi:MAG: CoA pyrophosphatase [Alkalispirochaeta sp.]